MTRNKMQYACRKTLADSRPRVRGRFAKNEELCEATRSSFQNQDQYEQSVSFPVYYTVLSETPQNSDSHQMLREMIPYHPTMHKNKI